VDVHGGWDGACDVIYKAAAVGHKGIPYPFAVSLIDDGKMPDKHRIVAQSFDANRNSV
jgi:hypothetical protein